MSPIEFDALQSTELCRQRIAEDLTPEGACSTWDNARNETFFPRSFVVVVAPLPIMRKREYEFVLLQECSRKKGTRSVPDLLRERAGRLGACQAASLATPGLKTLPVVGFDSGTAHGSG